MTAAELLRECLAMDIVLLPHGDQLDIDAPQGVLTTELKARLREHKAELLVLLPSPAATPIDLADADAVWQAALDRLQGDPFFPPDLIEVLRSSETRWGAEGVVVAEDTASRTARRRVCRCGSTTSQDVPIHNGRSVRRDCACCGRFIEFPVWHGELNIPQEHNS